MKKKIAILFGGCSSEYSVSLQSASSVISHLNTEKYEPILIGITREGQWLHYTGPVEKITADTWQSDGSCTPAVISPSREAHGILRFSGERMDRIFIDAAFPVLHGRNGEDGTVQGLLELSGIPFIGCGTLSSALCMDKDLAHIIAKASGVMTPPFLVLRKGESLDQISAEAVQMGFPLFVKPARAGSSFGITRVRSRTELKTAMEKALEHDVKIVIEKAVDGFEVGCAVLGIENLIVGELDEIQLTKGFFDFHEKYTLETSKIHLPARIDTETAIKIKETAVKLYRLFECSGFARVDVFLTPEGDIIFNEINTIPGFTAHSRYPSMLDKAGMPFEKTIENLIEMAMRDERSRI